MAKTNPIPPANNKTGMIDRSIDIKIIFILKPNIAKNMNSIIKLTKKSGILENIRDKGSTSLEKVVFVTTSLFHTRESLAIITPCWKKFQKIRPDKRKTK